MPFNINFCDEDANGNPTGSFSPHVKIHGMDPKKLVSGSLDLDVYPTGGFSVSAIVGLFDNNNIEGMIIGSAGGYTFEFVKSTGKIKGYSGSGTEISNSTSLATITGVPFIAYGR